MPSIAYKLMQNKMAKSDQSNEELATMADVYYGAKRMTAEEYSEVVERIGKREE